MIRKCTFHKWCSAVHLSKAQALCDCEQLKHASLVREDMDLQMDRVRYSCGLRMICHTIARAGQLSMHQSFRVWQLPLLEKRAMEPLEHTLLSEIDMHRESHREAMRDADHHARGLRAACLVEHTIRGAWCAHKQATMRVWAGVVRHRIIHRGAQLLASPLNLASLCLTHSLCLNRSASLTAPL